MGSIVVTMVAIVMVAGWIVWKRRHRRQAVTTAVPPQGIFLAHKAFVHGNTCLKEEKFTEAIAAFYQVHELDPHHPHVAGRLVEVERQQQAVSPVALASATC